MTTQNTGNETTFFERKVGLSIVTGMGALRPIRSGLNS